MACEVHAFETTVDLVEGRLDHGQACRSGRRGAAPQRGAEPLPAAELAHHLVVRAAPVATDGRGPVAPEHRERGGFAARAVERAHARGTRAGSPCTRRRGRAPRRGAAASARGRLRAGGGGTAGRRASACGAAELDADLVEPVPAHARLERLDVGEAVPPVGARGAPDRVGSAFVRRIQRAVLELVAGAARDREPVGLAKAPISRSKKSGSKSTSASTLTTTSTGARRARGRRRRKASRSRARRRPWASGSSRSAAAALERADPGVLGGELGENVRRGVGRAVVDDDPLDWGERSAQPGPPPRRRRLLLLVAGGGDDRVAQARHAAARDGRAGPTRAAGSSLSQSSSITSASSRFALPRPARAPLARRRALTAAGSTTGRVRGVRAEQQIVDERAAPGADPACRRPR